MTSVFGFRFLLLHGFGLWIHLQLKHIFFFRNADSKSPSGASPNWALLTDSWNPGLAAATGSSQALVSTPVCLVLLWGNSFKELTHLKIINTKAAHSPMHFCYRHKTFRSYWWVLLYIYRASNVDKTGKVPVMVKYNTVNVYLQKQKCDMTPVKTVSLLEAGV